MIALTNHDFQGSVATWGRYNLPRLISWIPMVQKFLMLKSPTSWGTLWDLHPTFFVELQAMYNWGILQNMPWMCVFFHGRQSVLTFFPVGYGSIPIDTFLVGWTSIYQLFWGSLGTRVLTHPQLLGCTGMHPKHRTIAYQVTLWHQLHHIAGPKEATARRVCHPARRVCRVRRPIAYAAWTMAETIHLFRGSW